MVFTASLNFTWHIAGISYINATSCFVQYQKVCMVASTLLLGMGQV